MSNTNSSSGASNEPSAIVAETSNFVLQRYIRQSEINNCTNPMMAEEKCACLLSGSSDASSCMQGYLAAKAQTEIDKSSEHLHLVKWCLTNELSKNNESWKIGCINGIRK